MPIPFTKKQQIDKGGPHGADSILHNAKIATNALPSFVEAIAIKDGKISAVGTSDEIVRQRGPETKVIDFRRQNRHPWPQRLPHASDSRWVNYNMELRWDGRVVSGRFASA